MNQKKTFRIVIIEEGDPLYLLNETYDNHREYLARFSELRRHYYITSELTESKIIIKEKPDLFSCSNLAKPKEGGNL